MSRKPAAQLRPGDRVQDTFAVMRKSLATYGPSSQRAGERYLRLQLGDASGVIEARIWDNAEKFAGSFDVDDLLYIEGQVVDYMGPQINVSRVEKRSLLDVDPTIYQPSSCKDRDSMVKELLDIVTSVENPWLRLLLEAFFRDPDFMETFTRTPGGMRVHHAFVSGLLEHTLEVVSLTESICRMHPDVLDLDLLKTGALLHDVGKVEEYDLSSISFQLTDKGKLIGHVVIGKEMLDKAVANLEGFPKALKMELDHMILSHHGQKDWGAPEVPKTINAFALFYADLVSARMNQFVTLVKGHEDPTTSWTPWDKYLERSAYVSSKVLHNDA